MGIPEPSSPLWTAVKAIHDPWPPDDEVVARDVSGAWRRGGDVVAQGANDTAKASSDAQNAWRDQAGTAFDGRAQEHTRTASQAHQQAQALAAHGERYASELESAKNTINSTIAAKEKAFALAGNPLLIGIGPALQKDVATKTASELQRMIAEKAAGLRLPDSANAGVLPVNPKLAIDGAGAGTNKYGTNDRDGNAKKAATPGAFSLTGGVKGVANLAEGKASGQTSAGGVELSGTATGNIGANGSAVAGITQDGVKVGVSGQVGATGTVEGKANYGILGATAKGTGFAGAEAEANLTAGKDGIQGQAGAFAGAKAGGSVGGDIGGVGAGVTGEAWAGAGAEAEFNIGKGEDGKWHIGGNAGAGLGVGAKVGGEITVDPAKVINTVADASKAVGDLTNTVEDTVSGAGKAIGGLFE